MKSFLLKPYLYIIIVAVGIGLKFYKIQDKFFWDDEIATILHTSGISMDEYEKMIPVNTIFPEAYFDEMLALNSRDLNIFKQIHGLTMMPQLTPGHYYYLIFWVRIFGDGYMSYRFFSVFIFLLSIPMLFLLSKKLFNSNLAGWIAISLYAVSPFFQIYTQEARYYILWSLAIITMHYLFLMAVDKQKRLWWGLYIAAGVLAVHTTVLFALIFLMHVIYFTIFHRQAWKAFALSLGVIFLSSLPWLIYVFIHRGNIQDNLAWQTSFGTEPWYGILMWHFNGFVGTFYDLVYPEADQTFSVLVKLVFAVILLCGLVVLFRKASKRQLYFVILSTFVGVIVIAVSDMLRGGIASLLTRYQLLNFIGILLLFGFGGKQLLKQNSKVFAGVFSVLILAGMYSSKNISDDTCAMSRKDSYYHVEDAKTLFSGKERILIVSDYKLFGPNAYSMFMSLMYACENENIDLIYAKPDYPNFALDYDLEPYDKIYTMYISEGLSTQLQQNFKDDFKLLKDRKVYGMPVPMYHLK